MGNEDGRVYRLKKYRKIGFCSAINTGTSERRETRERHIYTQHNYNSVLSRKVIYQWLHKYFFDGCPLPPRVFSKQTKINFCSNRNKPKQDLFRVCFVKPKIKNFGLFRCFEPISKQPKQTELFRNKPKQTETTLNFLKNTQIYSLLNCLGQEPEQGQ
jgi:hypothetical protein